MKKTTIIFDFDGTIADSLSLVVEIANEILGKKNGKNLLTSELLSELRNKSAKDIMQFLKIPIWKLPFILIRGKKLFKDRIGSVKCFPHMKETLQKLKDQGLELGILSSNVKETIESFLHDNEIREFDFVYSERNIFGKSEALKNLLNRYNLEKVEVIYVGDEVRDIEACKKAGIEVISVTWGFNSKEVLEKNNPDYLVKSPKELLKILSG